MGEFSRRSIRSRQAEPGEEVVLTRFGSGGTRGFAAVGDPSVAVSLPPGTEVRFAKPVACEPTGGNMPQVLSQALGQSLTGHQAARLRQVIVDNPSVHLDALEFAGSQFVLLTQLCEGQRATVVQLPASGEAATPFRNNRRLPLEDIRLLTEPADDSGHPLFI